MIFSQVTQVDLTHIKVCECLDLKPPPTPIFPHIIHTLQFSASMCLLNKVPFPGMFYLPSG